MAFRDMREYLEARQAIPTQKWEEDLFVETRFATGRYGDAGTSVTLIRISWLNSVNSFHDTNLAFMVHQLFGLSMTFLGKRCEAKMKMILSRKEFDSASGGIPNPILPDGTLLKFTDTEKMSPRSRSWYI